MELGNLKNIKDLRKVWKNEAYDFTNWLAKEENLEILSNEIGVELELISTEAKTGSFSTDILAKESNTENKVIIENQLENTDHDHLGKIITYAAGHEAKTIIWIVKDAREEHRQAIDWLNEHSDEEINIFLCKIELWQIEDSKLAPKFNIISRPNNWTKTIRKNKNNISETGLIQYTYWSQFKEYLDNNSIIESNFNPPNDPIFRIAIGKPIARIDLTSNTIKKRIRCRIFIKNSKELFDYLYNQKDKIEKELGFKLEWMRKDNQKSSLIRISKKFNILDKNNWDEAIKWHTEMAESFYKVFPDMIKKFDS